MFKRNVLAVSMTLAALCAAQAAMADVNGGGATLPQPLYQTAGVLPAGFAAYIGVGSGNGKAAFLTNDYTKFVAGVTNKNVHWAGSDSKLSTTELSTYASQKQPTWGKLIQVPSVATSVAIPFNKAGANDVNLSTDQLCGVFSGRLTNWSQITGAGRTGPIKVVYRSESSGTTELFTRFLAAKCTEAKAFAITTTFSSSYGNVANSVPAGAVAATGSQGVMTTLNATDGGITYMSPDYAATTLAGLDDAKKVAKVNGKSPAPANVSAAIAQIPEPTEARPGAVIDPTNPDNWVPVFGSTPDNLKVFAYPTTGYPILGFTNIIASQCYLGTNQNALVRSFFEKHYDLDINNDTAITDNRFVPLPDKWKTAIYNTFADVSSAQGIGNTNVCNGKGRPF